MMMHPTCRSRDRPPGRDSISVWHGQGTGRARELRMGTIQGDTGSSGRPSRSSGARWCSTSARHLPDATVRKASRTPPPPGAPAQPPGSPPRLRTSPRFPSSDPEDRRPTPGKPSAKSTESRISPCPRPGTPAESENHSSTGSGHTLSEQGAVVRVRRPDLAGPDSRCRREARVTPGRVTDCGRAYRRRARALARLFARRLHPAAGYTPSRRPGSNRTTSAHQCSRAGMTLTAGVHD
jgi:hypothetical protein